MSELTMQVEDIKDYPKAVIATLNGDIDGETVMTFRDHLASFNGSGKKWLIIDMGGVKYINSTGFGCLINFSDSFKDGHFVLVKIQQKVKVVLDLLGLQSYFKTFVTRDEALRYLKSEPELPKPTDSTVILTKPNPTAHIVSSAGKRQTAESPVVSKRNGSKVENVVECKYCKSALNVYDSGAYKCPRCLAVFSYVGKGIANFLPRRRISPIQLGLALTPECTEGLSEFIRLISGNVGFREKAVNQICESIHELIDAIKKYAYGNGDGNRYNVLIIPSEGEMELQFSDYGKAINPNGDQVEKIFPRAKEVFDRFDIKPHPKGGNVIVMLKKV